MDCTFELKPNNLPPKDFSAMTFFPKSFIVLHLTFKSMIYFEASFIACVRFS